MDPMPIKAGRAIDSASINRRRKMQAQFPREARERRAREVVPNRQLTDLEERVLRRFGYEPYGDPLDLAVDINP